MSSEPALTRIWIVGLYFTFGGLFLMIIGAYHIYTPFLLALSDATINSISGGVLNVNFAKVSSLIGASLIAIGIANVIIGQGLFRLKKWAWFISIIFLIFTSFLILPLIFTFWMFDQNVKDMFFRKPGIQRLRIQKSGVRAKVQI